MAIYSSFTEKEMFNDLLMSEKQVSSAYAMGITESTCPNLRKVLLKCEEKVLYNQEAIFSTMHQRGWYPVKPAQPNDVENAKTKYNQIKSELI